VVRVGSSVFVRRYVRAYMPLVLVHLTCRSVQLDKASLKPGTRVALDVTTLTIMRKLPREVDPTVFQMVSEEPGKVSFSSVGGLNEQIRELREVRQLRASRWQRCGDRPPFSSCAGR